MQRLLKNLTALVAAAALISTGSLAFAHGGGGGHSGGHSVGPSSSVSRTSSQSQFKPVDRGHGRTVSDKGKDGFKGPRHPVPRHPWPRGPRPPYHMCYPVTFWFGGDFESDDGDVAADDGIDVQFTSIRQFDAGDPAKGLAPSYRVWFTNNSDVDINQPFDVAILASTDGKLAKDLPYAAVRIDGLAAGETSYADIRLPIDAMKMSSGGYRFVHAIIDSQNELTETNKDNNVAVFNRDDIPQLGTESETASASNSSNSAN